MSAADLPQLVADARLILEYAVRAGKLPDTSLAEAIHRLEAEDNARNIIDLQNAMNIIVIQIAPMTLVDLRAGRNPFDQRNVQARSRWQFGLSLSTVLLIIVIAFYQYSVQRQDSALRAYKAVVEARGTDRITEARNLVQQGHALAVDSCQWTAYQKARVDLKLLADRTVVATKDLADLSQESPWPLIDFLSNIFLQLRHNEAVAVGYSEVPNANENSRSPQINQKEENRSSHFDPCDETLRMGSIATGYPGWLRNVVFDAIDEFCFASQLGVDALAASDPLRRNNLQFLGPKWNSGNPVVLVEQRIRVQTSWLLPFLYGLLGACVYVMRRLLFDTKAVVVENVVIVLRLALGALAGVAIGWFTVPSSGPLPSLSSNSVPYALAFLGGFSIDILFAVLDSANRTLLNKTHTSA